MSDTKLILSPGVRGCGGLNGESRFEPNDPALLIEKAFFAPKRLTASLPAMPCIQSIA